MRLARALCLACVAALPLTTNAEGVGEFTMFVDGEQRVWHAITMVQSGQTVWTATLEQRNHLTELQLQGHPVPHFTSKDVLSIDIRYSGQYAPGDEPASVEILYTPNGLSGPLWTSRGAKTQPRLQIVAFDIWGNAGQLIAVVTGEICIRPRLFSQTDPTNCKSLNGKVETRLQVN